MSEESTIFFFSPFFQIVLFIVLQHVFTYTGRLIVRATAFLPVSQSAGDSIQLSMKGILL